MPDEHVVTFYALATPATGTATALVTSKLVRILRSNVNCSENG